MLLAVTTERRSTFRSKCFFAFFSVKNWFSVAILPAYLDRCILALFS